MTINEDILDGNIRHMVYLERYKSQSVRKIISLLNKVDDDLTEQIIKRLIKIEDRGLDIGKDTTKRLNELRDIIKKQRFDIIGQLNDQMELDLVDFAEYEADFQVKLIENAVPVEIALAKPAVSQLRAAALSQPFRGRLLKEWFDGLANADAQRINDAVRIGITEGQTTDQIVRRIRGTKVNQYSDGVLDITRREAAAIVRTATAHVSHAASMQVYNDNAEVIRGLKWVSTLDGRTSAVCRSRDGKIYEVGKTPPVPAHFNCRSRVVPYLGNIDIKGSRAAQGGAVPDDVSYGDWLRKQDKDVQEDILGVKKAGLFRNGMKLDRFVDKTGREYTLDELKTRDKTIWNKTFK